MRKQLTQPPRSQPQTATAAQAPAIHRYGRFTLLLLVGLLLAISLLGIYIGAVQITPGQVLAIGAANVGITLPWEFDTRQEAVLMAIRLPRVVLGILIGAALATAGAALQGLFRNPLADPGLIGISSGAALGATAIIVLGNTFFQGFIATLGYAALPLAAFIGGVVTTLVISHPCLDCPLVVATGVAIRDDPIASRPPEREKWDAFPRDTQR